MNKEDITQLSFNAHFIESFAIGHDMYSDCKLRSKSVHEKLVKARVKDAVDSVILKISEKGLKMINPLDLVVLSSSSIQRISYSACDRLNRLFALVVRLSGSSKGQLCYIFRMNTSEQADSINRYFGSIFKQLHNQKKERKNHVTQASIETAQANPEKYENVSELFSYLEVTDSSKCIDDDNIDSRLQQISTSNINELVSEKHNIRRLSLSMPNTDHDEIVADEQMIPQHSSLEKNNTSSRSNFVRPVVRRKKPEHKGNRISAAIERWSFRGSREMSSDYLKSGSPVVALKEQLEYEDLISAGSSHGSESCQDQGSHSANISHSNSRKLLTAAEPNLCITNDSKANNNVVSQFLRKNSAPITNFIDDEQPPVPPVRIHSLRVIAGTKTLSTINTSQKARSCGEGASQSIPGCYDDDDDDLSSITTPSSCDQMDMEQTKFSVYNEPPPPPTKSYREPIIDQNYNYASQEPFTPPTPVNTSNQCQTSAAASVPSPYFRDCNKMEAMSYLLDKEMGGFVLRYSDSHRGCLALSVKVADNLISHYIIQHCHNGLQLKGLDKTWPNIQSLVTHLSVIPEILPCPIRICPLSDRCSSLAATATRGTAPTSYVTASSNHYRHKLPQSQSADIEYQQRMKYFLRDIASPASVQCTANPASVIGTDQYQQLSDFSSIVASLDFL